MSSRNFRDLLEKKWSEGKFVCVGLDSDLNKIPRAAHVRLSYTDPSVGPVIGKTLSYFNRHIVEVTSDLVCAYKLNLAFYLRHGPEGIGALRNTIEFIHQVAPDVPVILDAKFADIGNTNNGYIAFAFEYLCADAVTVNPYLGCDEGLDQFLQHSEKGIIVLCCTSNIGGHEFQDLRIDQDPLYQHVARNVARFWNDNGNCALVAGATFPSELKKIRQIVGDLPLLIPGIGTQGGEVETTVAAGKDSRGRGMIINASRSIIFASNGDDYPDAARRETEKLHQQITAALVAA